MKDKKFYKIDEVEGCFVWYADKAKMNKKKHGISFEDAANVFKDFSAICIHDSLNSHQQQRFLTIGRSSKDKILVVSYREWDEDTVNIISARLATKGERKSYLEGNQRAYLFDRG